MKNYKKSINILFVLCLLITVSCTQVEIAQWRGPERNGIYPEKNLLTSWPEGGPQLVWKFDSLGLGYSSPVVTSERVLTAGTIDSFSYLFSFNLEGKLLWKKTLGRDWMGKWPGIYSTPIIAGEFGYIASTLGSIFCFNTGNGDVVWSKNILKESGVDSLKRGFVDNMIIDGEKLLCTPGGKEINCMALDRRTGQVLWTNKGKSERDINCSPILAKLEDSKYYIYQTDTSLISVNSENGELAWTYKKKERSCAFTLIYQNGYLFTPDYNRGSIMLKISKDGKNVSEVWRNPDIRAHMGDAIVLGDRIFGRGRSNKLYCIDWNTGKEIYKSDAKSMVTTLISAEGMLYCYDIDGDFYLLQPLSDRLEKRGEFKVLGGTEYHCSHPVIKDGRLYIRHDNSLFAYNISK